MLSVSVSATLPSQACTFTQHCHRFGGTLQPVPSLAPSQGIPRHPRSLHWACTAPAPVPTETILARPFHRRIPPAEDTLEPPPPWEGLGRCRLPPWGHPQAGPTVCGRPFFWLQ